MIRIKALGSIVHGAEFVTCIQGKPFLIPVGYEIERPVFDETLPEDHSDDNGNNNNKKKRKNPSEIVLAFKAGEGEGPKSDALFFTATIDKVGGPGTGSTERPRYTVTRSDDPARKRYTSDKAMRSAWRLAVAEAERDFPDKKDKTIGTRDAKGVLQVNGMRLFALSYNEVALEINALPGAPAALEAFARPPHGSSPADGADATAEAVEPRVDEDAADAPLTSQGTAKAPRPPRVPLVTAEGGRKRTSRSSSGQAVAAARGAAAEGGDGNAVSPPSSQKKRGGRSAASAPQTQDTAEVVVEDREEGQPPLKKRARKLSAKGSDAAGPVGPPAPPAACPDCGLVGTPFCAATGTPHPPPVCALCGLSTAFCPVSGHPHAGPPARLNRQRGEVHLPSRASARRKKPAAVHAAAAASEDGVAEVTVIATQEDGGTRPAGKRGAKRMRASGDAEEEAPPSAQEEGAAPAAKKLRGKRGAAKSTTADTAPSAGQTTLDASVVPIPEDPLPPKEYKYAPLRPPLSASEQHRAAHLQAKRWKEKPEQEGCPPHIAALHLPLVAYRSPRPAAAAASARRKKKGDAAGGDEVDNEEETGKEPRCEEDNGNDEDDDKDKAKKEDDESMASTKKERKASLPSVVMVHSLEVPDAATSASGKRFLRFLQQYTSERTKGDLLRAAASDRKAAAAAARKGSGSLKAEGSVTGDGEGGNEAAHPPDPQPPTENGEEEEAQQRLTAENEEGEEEERAASAPTAAVSAPE